MLPLETILEEFRVKLNEVKSATLRQAAFPQADNMIKVAIGMRRTGKTYFLYQVIQSLLNKGVPLEAILYINFEDDRLFPMNQTEMASLLEYFYTLYPDNHQRQCYLFLDELQNIDGWERVVRRFFDTKKVQIYLTGSSAKLLSKEIATSLRGRSLSIEIWPYDFTEYLLAHSINLPKEPFGKMALDLLNKHFLNYLNWGGFPAVQALESSAHREALQQYLETVILRDVVERHRIANITLLKYLANVLLKNFSSLFSANKFFNDVKSQGYQLSKDTVYQYIGHLEDAYLIASVPLFTESLRRSSISSKKIYGVDLGLIQAVTFSQLPNFGRLLENLVYLDLRRKNDKIFYYITSSGYEIDFVIERLDGTRELIQVAWDLSDAETKAREERALDEAKRELGMPGRIIDKEIYLKEFNKFRR